MTTAQQAPASLEQNKQLCMRFFEDGYNRGQMAAADAIIGAGHAHHDPSLPGLPLGPEGVKALWSGIRAGLPDIRFTIDSVVAEGDTVMARWTARGTHQGELVGVPATGRTVEVTGVEGFLIADGKIAESWANWDTLGLLTQLGVR